MGETGFCENLRFPAVSCENLRFPAVFCANLRLPNPLIYRASRKSAKICENVRSGSGFSLLLSPFWRALNLGCVKDRHQAEVAKLDDLRAIREDVWRLDVPVHKVTLLQECKRSQNTDTDLCCSKWRHVHVVALGHSQLVVDVMREQLHVHCKAPPEAPIIHVIFIIIVIYGDDVGMSQPEEIIRLALGHVLQMLLAVFHDAEFDAPRTGVWSDCSVHLPEATCTKGTEVFVVQVVLQQFNEALAHHLCLWRDDLSTIGRWGVLSVSILNFDSTRTDKAWEANEAFAHHLCLWGDDLSAIGTWKVLSVSGGKGRGQHPHFDSTRTNRGWETHPKNKL